MEKWFDHGTNPMYIASSAASPMPSKIVWLAIFVDANSFCRTPFQFGNNDISTLLKKGLSNKFYDQISSQVKTCPSTVVPSKHKHINLTMMITFNNTQDYHIYYCLRSYFNYAFCNIFPLYPAQSACTSLLLQRFSIHLPATIEVQHAPPYFFGGS